MIPKGAGRFSLALPVRRRIYLKYWRGYLTAAIFAAITFGLMQLGTKFSSLVDMVYPYVIRTGQTMLAQWSGGAEFVLWQVVVIAGIILALASLVLMVILKWNPVQWFGWVLAVISCVVMLNTMVYGLNYYSGPLAEDIRLDVVEYNVDELAEATTYYRDKANALAQKVNRDENGDAAFSEFAQLAEQAGDGFEHLVYERSFPVFAGSTLPVKSLGWADWFTSQGITGVTVGLTGESAVNPQIPQVALPFTMAHEMAHRMCIAGERDGNFAAFLACSGNESPEYQYSAYFMAYKLCYDVLASWDANTAARIQRGENELLYQDLLTYKEFFAKSAGGALDAVADQSVCDLLVSWHIQEVVLPSITVEIRPFDPLDESQVDLSGIVNAKPTE
jgi:hypothetical protein